MIPPWSQLSLWLPSIGFIFGACIGSFLTVVVYRYPKVLQSGWRADCAELMGQPRPEQERFNLAWPPSHCPKCSNRLRFWHNIPLLGYFFLAGKCAFCKTRINWRYPTIEWMTAIVSSALLMGWGPTTAGLCILLASYLLIALAFIDLAEHLLPDLLTLGLLWIGLLLHAVQPGLYAATAIFGAAVGYLILWLINTIFYWIRRKPGMGHGDFKCLAAIGAWVGAWGAVETLLLATVLSLVCTIPALCRRKLSLGSALPFGPFLCLAGWVWINFGTQMHKFLSLLVT